MCQDLVKNIPTENEFFHNFGGGTGRGMHGKEGEKGRGGNAGRAQTV